MTRGHTSSPRAAVKAITKRTLQPDIGMEGHSRCSCGEFTHVRDWKLLNALPSSASPVLCQRCGHWMADLTATLKVVESFQRERDGRR